MRLLYIVIKYRLTAALSLGYSCAVATEELIESMHRCESNCNNCCCCICLDIVFILNSSSSHLVNVSNLNQQLQLHRTLFFLKNW